MDQVVSAIRSALTIRVAELLARGRSAELTTLVGSNPMLRLAEQPQNYLGELFGSDASLLPIGNWYFDSRGRVLCYLVESVEFFESATRPARACFAVRAVIDEGSLRGVRLAEVQSFAWRLQLTWPDWPWSTPTAPAAITR